MDLGSIEPPAPSARPRQRGELALGAVTAGKALEEFADELVATLPHGIRLLAGTPDNARVGWHA